MRDFTFLKSVTSLRSNLSPASTLLIAAIFVSVENLWPTFLSVASPFRYNVINAAGSSGVPVIVKELSGTSIDPSLTIRSILPLAVPPLEFHLTKSPTFNPSGSALCSVLVSSVIVRSLAFLIELDLALAQVWPGSPPQAAQATLPLLG